MFLRSGSRLDYNLFGDLYVCKHKSVSRDLHELS